MHTESPVPAENQWSIPVIRIFPKIWLTLSKAADFLICESALPDELKAKGHLTPSLAGEIATRANVRKLVLTHFYPECDHVDMRETMSKNLCRPAGSGRGSDDHRNLKFTIAKFR